MAKVLVTEAHLQAIADAIRTKNGKAVRYRPGDMATAILALEAGGAGGAGRSGHITTILSRRTSARRTAPHQVRRGIRPGRTLLRPSRRPGPDSLLT